MSREVQLNSAKGACSTNRDSQLGQFRLKSAQESQPVPPVVSDGISNTVYVLMTTDQQFFRLRRVP